LDEKVIYKADEFLRCFCSPMDSGIWKVIASRKELAKMYKIKEIGDRN